MKYRFLGNVAKVLVAIFLLQLTSCSYFIRTFIRNYSEAPIELSVRSMNSKIGIDQTHGAKFPIAKGIVKVKSDSYHLFNDSLEFIQLDSSMISMKIPANSTVRLTPYSNIEWYDTDSVEVVIKQDTIVDTFVVNPYGNKLRNTKRLRFKSKGLLMKSIFYCDYGR